MHSLSLLYHLHTYTSVTYALVCVISLIHIYILLLFFSYVVIVFYFFFFFQAEDGIRDLTVTGVQTCALPISFPCCPEKKNLSPRGLTALRLQGHPLNSLWTAGTSIRCHHDVPVSLWRKIVTARLDRRICRAHRNRRVIPVHPLHRRDKTIAQSRARLDKSRALRR